MRKCYQIDANMRSKINGKSMKFRNLRILVFCQEYNVKIVFLHDQGHEKSTTNQLKINTKSKLNKNMKTDAKLCQKGTKLGAKIKKKT